MIAETVLLLQGAVVGFVDDDQPRIRQRGKDGGAGTDNDAGLAVTGGQPVVQSFAIGEAGATNAALFAVAMLASDDPGLATALRAYRDERREQAAGSTLPPS